MNVEDLSPATLQRHEQLLRRLQAREITPLVRRNVVEARLSARSPIVLRRSQEILILREFVDHLQHPPGASSPHIENRTASWVVKDVSKLPEELRS